jgi:hypothetical protein
MRSGMCIADESDLHTGSGVCVPFSLGIYG